MAKILLKPNPDDVNSIDGIIKAFYDIVSGPPGAPRNWDRDRTLYIEGVQFVYVGAENSQSLPTISIMSHEEFIRRSEPVLLNGFFEREIYRITQNYGNIAHVLSTYESRQSENSPVTSRGVNSIRLFHDGNRWWIASAIWQQETRACPIPAAFLPKPEE